MKIKSDFVTNSSSTSFVGWGISFDIYDISSINSKFVFDGNTDKWEIFDQIDKLVSDRTLIKTVSTKIHDDGYVFVAGVASKLKDDETLKEFKEKVLTDLKELGFDKLEEKDIQYVSHSWYNG